MVSIIKVQEAGRRGEVRSWKAIPALALAYACLGWFGLQLAVPPGYATMIWPASGLAVGVLILYGGHLWAGVLIGSFSVNLVHGMAIISDGPDLTGTIIAALIAVGSTLQSVAGAAIVTRLFGRPLRFHGIGHILVFLAMTGPVLCVVAPTVGVGTLWFFGIVPTGALWQNWVTWWSGDCIGVLIFLPLVLFNPWRPWGVIWSGITVAGFSGATLIATVLPLGATFYAYKLTSQMSFDQSHGEFVSLANASERALIHRMHSYRLSLDGGAGIFGASETVSAAEWRAYTEILDIQRSMPGINGIGFIEPVRAGDIPAFVEKYADFGVPDLTIHPDTGAQERFVITYIEPLGPNLAAQGLDIGFEANRLEAAVSARDTGKATITRRILLVQDSTESPGFLLLRPFYKTGAPHRTTEERRAAFVGWIYAPFVGHRLLTDLTDSQGVRLNISVFDGDVRNPDNLIYSSKEADSTEDAVFAVSKTLTMMERNWTVVYESTPNFEREARDAGPTLILFGGLALTALVAALLMSYAHREDAIRRIVEQKTLKIAAGEQENRSIVNSAIVGIIVTDEDGIILSMNDAAQAIFSSAKTISDHLRISDLIEGIDGTSMRQLTPSDDALAQAQSQTRLFVAQRADGLRRHLDLQVNSWRTEHGTTQFTVVVRDITDEKKATDALQLAEQRWNFALTSGNIAVYDVDLRTGRSIVSDTWFILTRSRSLSGVDPQEDFFSRIHPQDRHLVEEADLAAICGATERSISEFRFIASDGKLIWLRSDGFVAERGPDGTALRLLGTMVDITAAKRAAEELKASEDRFRSAIEDAPLGMALVNPKGEISSVNSAFCMFLGHARADLILRDFNDLIWRETSVDEVNMQIDAENPRTEVYQGEHRFVHAEGHLRWGLLNISHAHGRRGQSDDLIIQVLDITERKEMDRMKNEFVATISHELRTPLTSIRGALGLVLGVMTDEISERSRKCLTVAQKNCDKLGFLVNDFLDLEKIASHSYTFDLKPARLCALVSQAIEANQAYANQFGVTLEFTAPDDDPVVCVDTTRFEQVISNLLSNAAKFSPADGTVTVTVQRIGPIARVSFADHGRGISVEFQRKIFERFSQEDSSATRQKGGTGLGLHIARQMMEGMGGALDFESSVGKGSTFWTDLPVAVMELQADPENPERQVAAE